MVSQEPLYLLSHKLILWPVLNGEQQDCIVFSQMPLMCSPNRSITSKFLMISEHSARVRTNSEVKAYRPEMGQTILQRWNLIQQRNENRPLHVHFHQINICTQWSRNLQTKKFILFLIPVSMKWYILKRVGEKNTKSEKVSSSSSF